jgi:hypothetical protein
MNPALAACESDKKLNILYNVRIDLLTLELQQQAINLTGVSSISRHCRGYRGVQLRWTDTRQPDEPWPGRTLRIYRCE